MFEQIKEYIKNNDDVSYTIYVNLKTKKVSSSILDCIEHDVDDQLVYSYIDTDICTLTDAEHIAFIGFLCEYYSERNNAYEPFYYNYGLDMQYTNIKFINF